ncbi:2Fe-2S iron-sulfur cluster-binding protein [Streptomyces sp. BA2]|uniref:2Fe-2S iron-sulfur cluster-binding protein n=1 Tax=Streptomyces sp. BA2 TaxID=436595 RepID=UPI001320E9EB|nr:(2Fe-2S)-binding protein [Streptomyces sp. BA2]
MRDDQTDGNAANAANGGWQPHPQGEYDSDATAFVQLPEGALDAFDHSPLAAPGHGYVPPQITVTPTTADATDPAATGVWVMPPEVTGAGTGVAGVGVQNVQWPDAGGVPEPEAPVHEPEHAYDPRATGQWSFHEAEGHAPAAPAPADVTGQWSIPVANGDLPDESGEFTTSSLAAQWGGTPPATLPGGAAAPWATGGAGAGAPWSEPAREPHAEQYPHAGHAQHSGHAETQTQPQQHVEPQHHEPVVPPEPFVPEPPVAPEMHVVPEGPVAHEVPETPDAPAEPEPEPGPEPEAEAEPEADVEAEAEAETEAEAEAEAEAEDPEEAAATTPLSDEHPLCSYVLRVNGADRPVTDAWIGESLLYVLRERLGLAGAKDGCSQGECGACNVQVDGRLVASCLVPAATAAGSEVRTVEGLATDGRPSDVQRALAACGAVQCGFCVPGMAMTLHDLLEGNPAPTDLETRRALCGNLCRCSGYRGVLDAVQEVVAEREASAAAAEPSAQDDHAGEARIPHQAGPGAGGVNPAAQGGSYEGPYGQDGGQA